ncbi:hypothetical protein DKX38_024222 [Salix brachista]|uniref:Pyruvate kinase n=1 Tax=Salix brachista TaxID=2182728 RepID=A0A5N5JRC5_9ROSI|nr:hypothetical protein DKX38_024222 [Salix brachista]
MTKIVGTLGPKSRSVEVISGCLKAGMSGLIFHGETLENLKAAVKTTKKLCAVVMLDTVGAELQVVNKSVSPISLLADGFVILTPDQQREASSEVVLINFDGLSEAVKPGDTIFVGQYLFTGSESTSVWLEVSEVKGNDVVCVIKNSATLAGSLFTLHAIQIHIELPTLSDKDKEVNPVISTWGVQNKIDFLSLSYTRHAEDVRHAREYLSKLGDLYQSQIFAKIENIEGLTRFDEILQEADGIILSRGNLGIDLPPEKVFLFQMAALHKCNMAGKPAVVTRVVDSMIDNLRPTLVEAIDVANAVLDGVSLFITDAESDVILLGAETLRGLYPVETISTVDKICAEVIFFLKSVMCCFAVLFYFSFLVLYFKKTVKYVGESMSHLESIASSAVRVAIKVKASIIICFTSTGRAARLIAKYRPTMPVLSIVIPRLETNQLKALVGPLRYCFLLNLLKFVRLLFSSIDLVGFKPQEAEAAFEELKKAMTSTSTLAMPNFDEPFVIEFDASGDGIDGSYSGQTTYAMAWTDHVIVFDHLYCNITARLVSSQPKFSSSQGGISIPIYKQICLFRGVAHLILLSYMTLQAESTSATNDSILRVAFDHGKTFGVIKSHDRVVVCQKVMDASVVKNIELED